MPALQSAESHGGLPYQWWERQGVWEGCSYAGHLHSDPEVNVREACSRMVPVHQVMARAGAAPTVRCENSSWARWDVHCAAANCAGGPQPRLPAAVLA